MVQAQGSQLRQESHAFGQKFQTAAVQVQVVQFQITEPRQSAWDFQERKPAVAAARLRVLMRRLNELIVVLRGPRAGSQPPATPSSSAPEFTRKGRLRVKSLAHRPV